LAVERERRTETPSQITTGKGGTTSTTWGQQNGEVWTKKSLFEKGKENHIPTKGELVRQGSRPIGTGKGRAGEKPWNNKYPRTKKEKHAKLATGEDLKTFTDGGGKWGQRPARKEENKNNKYK